MNNLFRHCPSETRDRHGKELPPSAEKTVPPFSLWNGLPRLTPRLKETP